MNYKHKIIDYTDKNETLLQIIKENDIKKALIFCNKKQDIEKISLFLNDEHKIKTFGIYNGVDEEFQKEAVKKFNTNKNIFLAVSDSIAKKITLKEKVDFLIATDLPTRAYDYKKRMLNYLNENGSCWTLNSGKNPEQLEEINKISNQNTPTTCTESKKSVKPEEIKENKTEITKSKCPFKGNIPAFLKLTLRK